MFFLKYVGLNIVSKVFLKFNITSLITQIKGLLIFFNFLKLIYENEIGLCTVDYIGINVVLSAGGKRFMLLNAAW